MDITPTAGALLGFCAWTILLVLALGALRTALVMGGQREANSFAASGADLDGLGKRLTRAHANCYEFLPVAGLIMVYAIATDATGITDPLAGLLLGARILQSLVHIASTANPMVLVRFALFAAQLGIAIWWLLRLAGLA